MDIEELREFRETLMQTILSQAAQAKTAKAEGATTIPKGSRPQVGSKRGASHSRDEKIVWTCWRQQENEWKRLIRNDLGLCFLQYNVYGNTSARPGSAHPLHRRLNRDHLDITPTAARSDV